MKFKSPSKFLLFALFMYFAEGEFDDKIFFTRPLLSDSFPYENTKGFKEFLKNKCKKCKDDEDCMTNLNHIFEQMKYQLTIILEADFTKCFY